MKHIIFDKPSTPTGQRTAYKVAILIKDNAFNQSDLQRYYVNPIAATNLIMQQPDLTLNNIIAFNLKYNEHGKAPVKLIKSHLTTVLQGLQTIGVKTVLVADVAYFKTLTKLRKAEPHYGYVKPCMFPGGEGIDVVLVPNYKQLFYNPALQDKVDMGINTLCNHVNGTHVDLGQGIIHSAQYPKTLNDIEVALNSLHQYPALTCDIETFSLEFHKAGVGTCAFAWDQHNGIAFPVDRKDAANVPLLRGIFNEEVKKLLRKFFETYEGKLIYHNGNFDIKILIYELFMDGLLDIPGLIHGLDVMYRLIDDTKLITYLATNSTAGNNLSLKHNAFEFAGNYAQDDIEDINLIPLPELLEYNLVDCLSTWYVHNKNYPIMVQDDQLEIYNTIMIPSMRVITHMELIGMPMDKAQIITTEKELQAILQENYDFLAASPLIKELEWKLQLAEMISANAKLKQKVRPITDFKTKYNPASVKQTQELVYKTIGADIIDTTDTGQPATGAKTLKKILNKLINEYNITEEELNG